ncbi:MAG: histidine phosphatase family protein [Pseudomonadota bacterium]
MITLIRHGEAAAKWGDHPDPGLSEQGRAQAEAVGAVLSGAVVRQILTSPMQRCQETAQPLCRSLNLQARITPQVSEIPTPYDLKTDRVTWLRGLMSGVWSDAEPIVQDWRSDLLKTIQSLPDNTVVFTHFVAINAIVSELEGRHETTVFKPTYCSQTILERVDDTLRVKSRGPEAETRVL